MTTPRDGAGFDDAAELESFLADPRRPGIGRWAHRWFAADPAALATALPRLASPDLDYSGAIALERLLDRLAAEGRIAGKPLRIAILAGFTTGQLGKLLSLYLAAHGLAATLYEPDFGTFRQELLDPGSGLHAFGPDHVLILPTWRDLFDLPALTDDRAAIDAKLAAEADGWAGAWTRLGATGAAITQDLFAAPPWRALGNLDAVHPAGLTRFCTRLNELLIDRAPPHVGFHDVAALAGEAGRWRWSDPRFYFEGKLPCAPEALPGYAHRLAGSIAAARGRTRKCLALDLDNTLWGGVIGDDGLGGIRIGQGDPESEAYLAFQHYALALKERGILLAVCSKNTEAIAKEAFAAHPGMAIRLDDIACFMANWDDKATNLARIAAQLNIGIDSLVFVDDNPVERSIIRQLQPAVAVPEMPEDPAGYVHALDRMGYFEVPALSGEDAARAGYYKADEARQDAASSAGSLEDFLISLRLKAIVEPVTAQTLDRTVQLIARSNQFNLTTRRHGSAEIGRMMADPDWLTMTLSLTDRFGDNGLIAVILAEADRAEQALRIDTWLMSCRVLKRGVEVATLACLATAARRMGFAALIGDYLPTPKNVIVAGLFAELGFTRSTETAEGTRWRLDLDAGWTPPPHLIALEGSLAP